MYLNPIIVKSRLVLNKIYIRDKIELPTSYFSNYQYHSKILVFRDHGKRVNIKITRSLNVIFLKDLWMIAHISVICAWNKVSNTALEK